MNLGFHLTGPTILIDGLSVANICLLVTVAFVRDGKSADDAKSALEVKLGSVAVFLGLCGQVLYCLMQAALTFDWMPLGPWNSVTHLEASLSKMGLLLSVGTLFAALYGRGLRRYAGLWVAVTTWVLWSLSSLDTLFAMTSR